LTPIELDVVELKEIDDDELEVIDEFVVLLRIGVDVSKWNETSV